MIKIMKQLAYLGMFFLIAAGGLQGVATNRYVATNVPGSAYPFDSWAKAGTNIIEVVVVANANNAGDMVFVSNGTYYLTNQINVTNIIMTNFTGDRAKVIIDGNYPAATNRCFYMNHANAIVKGFTITNGFTQTNDNRECGGGVYLYKGMLKDCLITGNRCVVTQEYAGGGGGGINIYYGTADYCSVVGNIVTSAPNITGPLWAGGGGICLNNNPAAMVTNCYVAYNVATNNCYGGGFYLAGGKILNCTIVGNSAGAGSCLGGGINCHAGNNAEVLNCIIISNWAGYCGGGIYIAASSGAGISVQIRNCLITYNRGKSYGAGVYPANGRVIIDSCTIISNECNAGTGYGGGLCFSGTYNITNVWNCIIYDNYAANGPNLYDNSTPAAGPCKTAVVYSCTSPGSGFDIAGVVTSRPPFVNTDNGNYHLRQDSPCINKGTNRAWMTGGVDYDSNPRIRYGVVDMGTYEYISPGTVYKVH